MPGTYLVDQFGNPITSANRLPVDAQLTGRNTTYQRVLVNQAVVASGSVSIIINAGLGTKAIYAGFSATAKGRLLIFGCDNTGTTAFNGGVAITASTAGGVLSEVVTMSDYGGAPYFQFVFSDLSAAANTLNYVDVYYTKG